MPKPSQVRKLLMEEHDALRAKIAAVRAAADGARTGELIAAMHSLFESLRDLLAKEDELLVPTLEGIDAWGPQRAQRLAKEHDAERAFLTSAERWATRQGLTFPAVRSKALDFVAQIEAQLAVEERRDLRPDLLTEYPFPIDFGGG